MRQRKANFLFKNYKNLNQVSAMQAHFIHMKTRKTRNCNIRLSFKLTHVRNLSSFVVRQVTSVLRTCVSYVLGKRFENGVHI